MTNAVIETVTFKLAAGVSDTAFLETIPAVNTFLETCAGFVSRRLSKDSDNVWLDHLEWATLAEAEAASEALMQQESLMPFMQSFDMASVSMKHSKLQLSVG